MSSVDTRPKLPDVLRGAFSSSARAMWARSTAFLLEDARALKGRRNPMPIESRVSPTARSHALGLGHSHDRPHVWESYYVTPHSGANLKDIRAFIWSTWSATATS